MSIINPTLPTVGANRGDEEADVRNALAAILAEINGNIDSTNVKDGSLQLADLASAVLNNFLKLAVGADRKIAFGSAALPWPNNTVSSVATVLHGLPTAPVVVLVTPIGGVFGLQTYSVTSFAPTTFQLQAASSVTLNTTTNVAWLAIS